MLMTKSKSIYIRLSHQDAKLLDEEVNRRGVTRSAVARHAIRAWLRAVRRRRAQDAVRPAGGRTRARPRTASTIGAEMAEVLRRVERVSSEIGAEMAEVARRVERVSSTIGADMAEALKRGPNGGEAVQKRAGTLQGTRGAAE